MLDYLRRGASSKILGIIIFAPLIVAFAFWGIGPIGRLGGDPGWLAKVGDRTIGPEEFQRSLRNELQLISQQAGRPITPEQAHFYGIDRSVLARMAGSKALDQQVAKLGLSLSTQTIANSIRADRAFADIGGKFSKARFDNALHENGMTEADYIATRKRDDVREQLTDSLLTGVVPPQSYIELLHRYRGETRVIEHVTIDTASVIKIPEPDDAKLKAYYDANKRLFMTPEFRKIGVLLLHPDTIKAKIDITDEEIKKTYEANKDRYDIPETRHVYQIAFPNAAAAEKALPALMKAANFVEAAAALGVKESDVDLGMLARAKMIDPKFAEVAFGLKKDEVSKVVTGTFTTVIMKVTEITPGQTKTLADASAQVKEQLQQAQLQNEMQTLGNQVEDERSAGKPLAEAAKALGLEYKEIAAIDKRGTGRDGKPAFAGPEGPQIAVAAFAGSEGLDPDPIDLPNGGGAWITVLGVAPTAERPFDEAKADVKSAFMDAETRREVAALSARLIERLLKGESFAAVAKDAGGKPENTGAISRNTSPPGLTANGVQQAFALVKDAASSSPTADGKSRVVFKVAGINVAEAPSKAQADKLKQELTREMQSDLLGGYIEGLEAQLGYSVNEGLLNQVLGLGQAPK